MKQIIAGLALTLITTPALGFGGDYFSSGSSFGSDDTYFSSSSFASQQAERRRERQALDQQARSNRWGIEPGHIPYACGSITAARVKQDCQRSWTAHNPNDSLNYGR